MFTILLSLSAIAEAEVWLEPKWVETTPEEARRNTRGIMMLDTLRYVYRTGRMSKLGSRIASMFNIRPINEITEDGRVEMVDRTRNREAGLERMTEIIREDQKRSPLVFLLIFLGLGILVGKTAGKYWWQILLGFLLGVLCGHFWW